MPVHLTGRLICRTEAEAAIVRTHLPEHIRLTRQEPGCALFEVRPASPLVWEVSERFSDRAAFDRHQARTRASAWGKASAGIRRDFRIRHD
ncbi:MAG: putative quinol monooxygenase [Pararhodobacter sp.]